MMERGLFNYEGREVFYQCEDRHYDRGIVLLHGYSFNSDVWQKVGLYDALLNSGFNVYGIDVPGFPNSRSRFSANDEWIIRLLKKFIEEKVEDDKLAMLGASASCSFVLRFAESYSNVISALILVGPVGIKGVEAEKIKASILVVFGSEDPYYTKMKEANILREIKRKSEVVLEGARHACYLDRPKEFIIELIKFLDAEMDGKNDELQQA